MLVQNTLPRVSKILLQPEECDSWAQFLVHIFLSLFPVFTISTNFPIIALTLSNNLKALFLREGRTYPYMVRHLLFPVLALLPPTCVAMATHSLELLGRWHSSHSPSPRSCLYVNIPNL